MDFFTISSYPWLLSNIALTFLNSSSSSFPFELLLSKASSFGNCWKFGSAFTEFISSLFKGVTISSFVSFLLSSSLLLSFLLFSFTLSISISLSLPASFSSATFCFSAFKMFSPLFSVFSTVSAFLFSSGFTTVSSTSSFFLFSFSFNFSLLMLSSFSKFPFSFSSKISIHSFSFSASSSLE